MTKLFFFVAILLSFSGCLSEKEEMIKRGYPAMYAQGYEDGCSTGKGEANGYGLFEKNPKYYRAITDYKQGWDDGHRFCYNKEKSYQDERLRQDIRDKIKEKKGGK